jgi:hypothetical protein
MGSSTTLIDPPLPPPGHGCLFVLDKTGDSPMQWDRSNPEEVAKAEQHFNDLRSKGYFAYKVDAQGGRGEVITKFDPTLERIILHARPIGG